MISTRAAVGIAVGTSVLGAAGALAWAATRDGDDDHAPGEAPATPPPTSATPQPLPSEPSAPQPLPSEPSAPPSVPPTIEPDPAPLPTVPAPVTPTPTTPPAAPPTSEPAPPVAAPPPPTPPATTPPTTAPSAAPATPSRPVAPLDPVLRERPVPDGFARPTRTDWLRIQPGPAGVTTVADHAAHTVARGETLSAIARSYSQHYHLDVSWQDLQRTNQLADPNRIQVGQVLRLPPIVDARIDSAIASNPGLVMRDGQALHQVGRGETLSAIARHYSAEFRGVTTTAAGIQRANPEVVRDVNLIRADMPPLAIPGLSVPAAAGEPVAMPPTISQLDGREVATRRAEVVYEDGRTGTIDVMHYRLNGSHAQKVDGGLEQAMRAARELVVSGPQGGAQAAVVQARDGYWVAPLWAEEDPGLDDSTRTTRLFLQQADPWLQGWAELDRASGQLVTDNWPDPRDY